MTEKSIESRLIKKVEKLEGLALKFTSPGMRGVPDRIVLLPGGKIIFVELKNGQDGKLSEIQNFRINQLMNLDFRVEIIDSAEGVDDFINGL